MLFVQLEVPDYTRPAADEARIVSPSGELRSQAPIAPANVGEPVICGSPSIQPAIVAALPVASDVQADFRQPGGPKTYRVEVHEGSTWHDMSLIDALSYPEKPCAAPPVPSSLDGARFSFPIGAVDFCGMFVSYQAPTSEMSGQLRLGGTTFVASSPFTSTYVNRVLATPGTWACLHGTVVFSQTTPNVLTDFRLTTSPDQLSTTANSTACGVITALNVGDLPAGGSITLSGTTFDVGGLRRQGEGVDVGDVALLQVGRTVCIANATFAERDARTFFVSGGKVEPRQP